MHVCKLSMPLVKCDKIMSIDVIKQLLLVHGYRACGVTDGLGKLLSTQKARVSIDYCFVQLLCLSSA